MCSEYEVYTLDDDSSSIDKRIDLEFVKYVKQLIINNMNKIEQSVCIKKVEEVDNLLDELNYYYYEYKKLIKKAKTNVLNS